MSLASYRAAPPRVMNRGRRFEQAAVHTWILAFLRRRSRGVAVMVVCSFAITGKTGSFARGCRMEGSRSNVHFRKARVGRQLCCLLLSRQRTRLNRGCGAKRLLGQVFARRLGRFLRVRGPRRCKWRERA